MKITSPFRSFMQEYAPTFRGGVSRTESTSVYDTYEDQDDSLSDEAKRIEKARRELFNKSNDIRLGLDPHPQQTARSLAGAAFMLAHSAAPAFEIALTLNITHANLRAGNVHSRDMQQITELSLEALPVAYPEKDIDPYTSNLNQKEIDAHLGAIQNTTSERSFPQALEREWERLGQPIDDIIYTTERKILDSLAANRRKKTEITATRAFDPFKDD